MIAGTGTSGDSTTSGVLNNAGDLEDLCLKFNGGSGDLIRLTRLIFS
jgi:hypothetical protein